MEERRDCSVKTLIERFGFEQLTGDASSLNRPILLPSTNRPGLELAGFYAHEEPKRIVILGNKEQAFIQQLEPDVQHERFMRITNEVTPLILITSGNDCPEELLRVAQEKNFPVFRTDEKSSEIMTDMVTFLDEYLALQSSVHGVLMNVFGRGVLIIGESGMGKSEVALELILRGHTLIADDRVDLKNIKDKIYGRAPKILRGMLEIRGIGILDVRQMFGVRAYLEANKIDFVVEFQPWDIKKQYLRAGVEEQEYYDALGVAIPRLVFPVKEGRNMAALVETAVGDFMLKQRGIYSSNLFDEQVRDFIKKQNEEDNE